MSTRRGPGARIELILVVLAIVVVAGLGAVQVARTEPVAAPPGATATGVPVGDPAAPVTVGLYVDALCPACQSYQEDVGPLLQQLRDAGTVKVVYHPVAYQDALTRTAYSSRAANAAGCAAEVGVLPAYLDLLLERQPPAYGDGLSAEQLVALGREAGAGPGFAGCVRDDRYAAWVQEVTTAARRSGTAFVPRVVVEGRTIPRTADALRAEVQAHT